jgi:hypothetical protein
MTRPEVIHEEIALRVRECGPARKSRSSHQALGPQTQTPNAVRLPLGTPNIFVPGCVV